MLIRPLIALGLALAPAAASAGEITLMPGDDFCAAFNQAAAGDTVILSPGDYAGPCALTSGGAEGSPKTLRGADPADTARIVYDGASSNVLDVLAGDIVLQDLAFGPSMPDIDAVKIKDGSRITVQSCTFTQIGGISVSANSKDSEGVQILGNGFFDLQATGIYLGCHDGMSACAARDVLVAGNFFNGVDSPNVGYALEIKLDSHGVVRDNVIADTKGPGIEIYGSTDLTRVSLVERNLVIGARTSGTLEIGGGPALVRNNIVVGGEAAGISVYDYGGRGLVRAIQLVGNTVVGDKGPAIALSGWAEGKDLELTDNAAWQSAGPGPALPPMIPGVAWAGNVDCGPDPNACWLAPLARDFWPTDASPLLSGGAAPTLAEPLTDDFCGQTRGPVPHAGALERTRSPGPGPLPLDFKAHFACPENLDPTTGGTDTTTGSGTSGEASTGAAGSSGDASAGVSSGPVSSGSGGSGGSSGSSASDSSSINPISDDPGCACRGGQAPQALALLALLALLRRRRP